MTLRDVAEFIQVAFSIKPESSCFFNLKPGILAIQRIGTKLGAIMKPDFAINQTLLKIQVINGYLKGFWTVLRYDPIQVKNDT